MKGYPGWHSAENNLETKDGWLHSAEGIKPGMTDIIGQASAIILHHKSVVGREKDFISVRKKRRRITWSLGKKGKVVLEEYGEHKISEREDPRLTSSYKKTQDKGFQLMPKWQQKAYKNSGCFE